MENDRSDRLGRRVARRRGVPLQDRIAADAARGRHWNRGPDWEQRPLAPEEMTDAAGSFIILASAFIAIVGLGVGLRSVLVGDWIPAVAGCLVGVFGVWKWRSTQLRLNKRRDDLLADGYRLALVDNRFHTLAWRHQMEIDASEFTVGRNYKIALGIFLVWLSIAVVGAIVTS